MNRRQFISAGTILTTLAITPSKILSQDEKEKNLLKFPQPIKSISKGSVQEFELYIDQSKGDDFINNIFDDKERESILNLEHGYIK